MGGVPRRELRGLEEGKNGGRVWCSVVRSFFTREDKNLK